MMSSNACTFDEPLPAGLLTSTTARKQEVEDFFKEHGTGNIVEVKLMNGFGFIQYDNEADAKDVVPGTKKNHPWPLSLVFRCFSH